MRRSVSVSVSVSVCVCRTLSQEGASSHSPALFLCG